MRSSPNSLRSSDEALRDKSPLELKERYAAEEDLDGHLAARHSPPCARPRGERSRCATSTCSSSAASRCTKARSPRCGPAKAKRSVATLAAYLNALTGRGVHIVTVNEYLAQRDADWMAPVYRFLGLEVGVIKSSQSVEEKRAAYAADITYGTNNEFGFDYLRDNLSFRLEDRVQRASELCHRRRGRLDLDRRSPNTADHLGTLGREHRAVRSHQPVDPLAQGTQSTAGQGQRRDRSHSGGARRAQGRLARDDVHR